MDDARFLEQATLWKAPPLFVTAALNLLEMRASISMFVCL